MQPDGRVNALRSTFWGTRGSIAKPGSSTVRYGGNTSCVEVRSAGGTLVVLDCGTGAHGLGQALLASGPRPLNGHLLFTHTHWDHIQGFPFFAPLFVPGNRWDIYAPRGLSQQVKDTLAGQMQYAYFPVTLERLGATIHYHELVEGSFTVGDIVVTTRYLNHPALALGYRLECNGAVLVYATDHEPHSRTPAPVGGAAGTVAVPADHPGERAHATFLAAADLVIHDAQYTAAEYSARRGWGHSPVEYVVDMAVSAGAKRLALFHHDPLRDDDALDRIVDGCRRRVAATGAALELFAAAEGQVVHVDPAPAPPHPRTAHCGRALGHAVPAVEDKAIVVAATDAETAVALADAIRPDGIRVIAAADGAAALELARSASPALVILDQHLPVRDGLSVCRALRATAEASVRDVPVVLVSAREDPSDIAIGTDAGVTDWLIKPFSREYARTKIGAWLLRTRARWVRAALPRNEPERIAQLRQLQILDTPAEERFDRLTRLAQRLFDVPIALVSLVDADRQWFKSCQGLPARETSREVAFCAHAILSAKIMVVPDTLLDERFADNPLVSGAPHIRFYAGQPLCTADGSRVGTLCIIDQRPRELNELDRHTLRDVAALVQQELTR